MRDRFSLFFLMPRPSLDFRLSPSLRSLSLFLSFSSPLSVSLCSSLYPFRRGHTQFHEKKKRPENNGEKNDRREANKDAGRTRYLRGISHEVDPVLNIDEFARLDGVEWDQERTLDDEVDMRRRIFDHAKCGGCWICKIDARLREIRKQRNIIRF